MNTNWSSLLDKWSSTFALKRFPPANEKALAIASEHVSGLPAQLEALYHESNGLVAGPFKILPIEERTDARRTWDSLSRANDVRHSRFLGRSPQLLGRFLVFSDIGAGRAGAIDRTDGSIWFEEEGTLRQTDLSLDRFIEMNLMEQLDFLP